jgi:hypothetical protein
MITAAALFFQLSIGTAVRRQIIPAASATANNETVFPTFVNNIINNLTEKNLNKIEAAVEKQKPLIEQKLKELEPKLKEIGRNAEALSKQFEESFATPATLQENDATRQIVIKEEQSGSKNATVKVYTLMFANGKWILQPEWKLAAAELPDSLNKLMDTTIPLVQSTGQEN